MAHPSRRFAGSALAASFLAVGEGQAQWLRSQFGIGANDFSAVLIGKDGGQKLRVNDVPDLAAVYAVIDGMPMRGREMSADPGRC